MGRQGTSGYRGDHVSPLLERESELEALRAAVASGADGDGSLSLVLGPPGIGKTSLLKELVTGLDSARAQILSARAGELERDFPYGVMRQLLEPPLRSASAADRTELLAGAAAPAGSLLEGEVSTVPSEGSAIDHACYWLISNLADKTPVVLLVDDLHWADLASLRALVYLCRRLADLPAAVVATTRPIDQEPRRAFVERLRAEAVRVLEPAALSDTGAEQLIRTRLRGADASFCQACRAASGGNPFLLVELIGALEASGLDPVAANSERVRQVGPQSVMRSVRRRLHDLPPAATAVARGLAVLGSAAGTSALARLMEIEPHEVTASVDGLRSFDILALDPPLRFVHAIVLAAIYDDLSAVERSSLHRRAARLLAEDGASTDAVASHLLLTEPQGDPWTVERLREAASRGIALSAPETMATYLERALAESAPGVDRSELLAFLGAALFQLLPARAVQPLSEVLAITSDPWMRMNASRALGISLFIEARDQEALAVFERGIAEMHDRPEMEFELEMSLCNTLIIDLGGIEDRLARLARYEADPSGAERRDRLILARQAWTRMVAPEPAERYAAAARGAFASGYLIEDDWFGGSFEMAISALVAAGELDEARRHLDHTIGTERDRGRTLRAGVLLPIRSELHRRAGRLQLAEEDARVALQTVYPEIVFFAQAVAAMVLVSCEQGELSTARETLSEFGYDDRIPAGGMHDVLWLARGRLRLEEGDLQGGLEDVLEYGRIMERLRRRNPGHAAWRSLAAEVLVRLGRHQEALVVAGEELELAERIGVPALAGPAHRALGLATDGPRALHHLQLAVDLLGSSPFVLEHARAQLDLGMALRRSRQRGLSRAPLRAALETATHAGAQQLAERARDELLASGARPRRTALRGVEALTPSERRVASLAAQGLTNRQIAQTLYVTNKTIETHLRNVYDKLGIAGKDQLASVVAVDGDEALLQTA